MITRTIGATGQHPDINDWVSYVQANYVSGGNLTDDQTGAIQSTGCTVSTQQIISGWAPGGSSFTTTLTFDTGAAFGPNTVSNPLIFNTSLGAYFTSTYGASSGALEIRVNKFRLVGLQVRATGGYTRAIRANTATINDLLIDNCLIQATNCDQGTIFLDSVVDGTNVIIRNCLIMGNRSATNSKCVEYNNAAQTNAIQFYDNTFWRDNTGGGGCIATSSYGKIIAKGNVFVGFDSATTWAISCRDANASGSNNATIGGSWNNTGYGAGTLTGLTSSQFSIVTATEFEDADNSPTDFRLKSTYSQLKQTGTTISGIIADIASQTRGAGVEDIGCWQRSAGGGGGLTLALTGIAATASAGTLAKTSLITLALVGAAATATPGAIAPARSVALSGISSTASAGTLANTSLITIGLTGSSATASAGFISVPGDKTIALTGQGATAFAGTLAATLSKALTGSSVTASPGSLSKSSLITIALTGSQASCSAGTMTASGGTPPARWTPQTPVATIWTPTIDSTDIWTPQ